MVLFSGKAHAFPDLVRHNYVNCNTCHVSPTGGGAMTPYGRAMSLELLSAWGTERETSFLNGIVKQEELPEWLIAGGDVRYLQIFRDSPTRQSARSMWMQTEVELGAKYKQVGATAAIGQYDQRETDVRWISPRFYAYFTPRDELTVRAGRFVPVFGIAVPYHTLPTRQGLGFAPGFERNAVESVWSGELWNFAGSVSQTPDEKLATLQVNRNFLGHYRVGVSLLRGSTDDLERSAVGLHGVLGFTKQWAYLTEFTYQEHGLYHFSQLLYEPWKGFGVYLLEDYQKTDLDDSSTLTNSVGPGIRFFPRPHFELDAVYLKRRVAAVADRYDTYAWFVAHYYF